MAGAPGQYTQGLSVSPNNLSTSASAPSVPSSQQPDVGAPVPPPRRPSPTKMRQQQQHQEEPRKESVRHIPIFVEGRDAPVINRDRTTAAGGPYRKPADFYPSGAKKVPTVDKRQPVEPTTPIGPPPGPIPMGCSPQHMNVPPSKPAEPTSPLPCPDGPIPLPCSPDLYQQKPDPEVVTPPKEPSPERASSSAQKEVAGANQKDARSETPPKVFNVPINLNVKPTDQPDNTAHVPVPPPQPPKPAAPAEPQRKLTAEELAMEKMQKVKEQVAELVKRIEAFKGDKKDKEYRYLDEMLTRHLLALDSVETHGKDELRSLRKESIKTVNRCLSVLDHKAKASSDAEDNNAILSQLAKVTEEQQAKK